MVCAGIGESMNSSPQAGFARDPGSKPPQLDTDKYIPGAPEILDKTGNSATFRGTVFEPKSILCGYPKI